MAKNTGNCSEKCLKYFKNTKIRTISKKILKNARKKFKVQKKFKNHSVRMTKFRMT